MSTSQLDSVRQQARERPTSFWQESEPGHRSSLACTEDEKHFSEKDMGEAQVLPTVVSDRPGQVDDDDFPDGGLRAYLVLVGVCPTHL